MIRAGSCSTLALTLADRGDCLSDLSVLRDQPTLFGAVASTPTASRVVDAVDAERLGAIRAARAQARERAWAAGLSPARGTGLLILDFDATLVDATATRSERLQRISVAMAFLRWPASSMPPTRRWPCCCVRSIEHPTMLMTTSRCWTSPCPSCRSRRWALTPTTASPCWRAPIVPGPQSLVGSRTPSDGPGDRCRRRIAGAASAPSDGSTVSLRSSG